MKKSDIRNLIRKFLFFLIRFVLDIAIVLLAMVFVLMLLYFRNGSLELYPTEEQQGKAMIAAISGMIVSGIPCIICIFFRWRIWRKNRALRRQRKENIQGTENSRAKSARTKIILGICIACILGLAAGAAYRNRADEKKDWWYIAQDVMDYTGKEQAEMLYSDSLAEPIPEKICELVAEAEYYAFCEEAVFWVIRNDGDGGSQIWRYNRSSDTSEMYLESDGQISHLTVYDGYLIYGDRMHFCVLPLDGNPKEDVFDLNRLFANSRQRTAEYGNWLIGRTVKGLFPAEKMMYIMDQSTGKVILNNNYSEEVWMCVDGRMLNFTRHDNGLDYRWEGEEKSHCIQCLHNKKYRSSLIRPGDVTVEDGNIIGMLTVSLDPVEGAPLPQKYVRQDILFRVDSAEDTSEVIYRTPNNRTRILGYHDGYVCLLKGSVICTETLAGKDRTLLCDLRREEWYDYHKNNHRKIYFSWTGGNLIIRTTVDGERWIRSVPMSD